MSMTENEVTREMTFDEEYEILQREKGELFLDESPDSEPPFANCVVRRALRCIRKLQGEIQQYRAIGTVEELRELKEKATAKKPKDISELKGDFGMVGKCPCCNGITDDTYCYCDSCGQRLLWE